MGRRLIIASNSNFLLTSFNKITAYFQAVALFKTKIIGSIVLVLVIGVVAIGILSGGENPQGTNTPNKLENPPTTPEPDDIEVT